MERKQRLKIIPLGGLGEIGKNMMLLEYDDDIIVIDAGLMFPEEDMPGIDMVIPDASYLVENRDRVRGIVITHGHEDHIGALPHILPHLQVPVYSSRLTHGLISVKLKEHKVLDGARLEIVRAGDEVRLGQFRVEFFAVCHSIPDAMGLIIHTPMGVVVHSGDFKIDHTPVDGRLIDLARLARCGSQGVLAFLSDSTYAGLAGYTPSERVVGETLDRIIAEAQGRVIISTFASLISRIQQAIDASVKHGRRVFVSGRSMIDNIHMASELGYLHIPQETLIQPGELRNLPNDKVVIICTGTQGEPTSALVRIANGDHRQIHVIPGDTVVISATPVPGNESVINRTVDRLFRQGAEVLYGGLAAVHVHGHASQEELKLMLNLVKPRFFIPIHGEYRHLIFHAKLAQSIGIPSSNIFVLEDGDVLELSPQKGRVTGRVSSDDVYVDGLSVGNVGHGTLRDRRALSRDGIVVVIVPISRETGRLAGQVDMVSRGFADESEVGELVEGGRQLVVKMLGSPKRHSLEGDPAGIKVKDALGRFFYERTKRRPTIVPVVVEV